MTGLQYRIRATDVVEAVVAEAASANVYANSRDGDACNAGDAGNVAEAAFVVGVGVFSIAITPLDQSIALLVLPLQNQNKEQPMLQ